MHFESLLTPGTSVTAVTAEVPDTVEVSMLTSSRHWNLKTHIKRHHGGVGDPLKAENDYYSNRSSSYHPHQRHYPHRPPFSSTVAPRKEDFKDQICLTV